MSVYDKPAKIPYWAETGTRTEPPEGKKQSGWLLNDIPPSSYENWRAGTVGDWFQWIDERFDDGATNNELEININKLLLSNNLDVGGSITIRDDDFRIINSDPFMVIDWDLSDGDYMRYNRGSDQVDFFFASTNRAQINNDYLRHEDHFWSKRWVRMGDGITIGGLSPQTGWEICGGNGSMHAIVQAGAGIFNQSWNAYWDGAWRYSTTGNAAMAILWSISGGAGALSDSFVWRLSTADGVQGDPITWDEPLKIRRGGDIVIAHGLGVGHLGDVEDGAVSVGDAFFRMVFDGDPQLFFDGGDALRYVRGSNFYEFVIGAGIQARLASSGLRVRAGLYVGSTDTEPEDNKIYAEGNIITGQSFQTDARQIWFAASDDRIAYDDTAKQYSFYIDGTIELAFNLATGLRVIDDNFRLLMDGADPQILFDVVASQQSYIKYNRGSNSYSIYSEGTALASIDADRHYQISGDMWAAGDLVTYGNYVRFGGPTPFYWRLNGSTMELSLGTVEWTFGQTFMDCKGNYIDNASYIRVNDSVVIADDNFFMDKSSTFVRTFYDYANLDSHQFNRFDRTNRWNIGGSQVASLSAVAFTHQGRISATTDLVTVGNKVRFGGVSADDYVSFVDSKSLRLVVDGSSRMGARNESVGGLSNFTVIDTYISPNGYPALRDVTNSASTVFAVKYTAGTIEAGKVVKVAAEAPGVFYVEETTANDTNAFGITVTPVSYTVAGAVAIAGYGFVVVASGQSFDPGDYAITGPVGIANSSGTRVLSRTLGIFHETDSGDGTATFRITISLS